MIYFFSRTHVLQVRLFTIKLYAWINIFTLCPFSFCEHRVCAKIFHMKFRLFFDFSLNFLSNQITFPLTNFWHWIKFSKANCIVNTELHCQYGIYEDEARLLSVLLKKNYQSKEHIKSPQLVTKYLRLTLVFTRNSTIQENYNFSEVFS